jgi:hypothetical protein
MTDVSLLYPVWRYHPTRPALIVYDATEDAALGPGWYDSPAKCPPVNATPLEAAPPPVPAMAPGGPDPPSLSDDVPAPPPKRRHRKREVHGDQT